MQIKQDNYYEFSTVGLKEHPTDVIMHKDKAPPIFSNQSSTDFGVLRMGVSVNSVFNSKIKHLYWQCCNGLVKLIILNCNCIITYCTAFENNFFSFKRKSRKEMNA